MADQSSLSSPCKDSSLSSLPLTVPDAKAARDAQGHFLQPFKLAAVRYAVACGKSQKAAALDMGLSDKTLGEWVRDARPGGGGVGRVGISQAGVAGVVDAERFDELAQLRAQVRELTARTTRLTAERDFLKKAAVYFATPPNGGSK